MGQFDRLCYFRSGPASSSATTSSTSSSSGSSSSSSSSATTTGGGLSAGAAGAAVTEVAADVIGHVALLDAQSIHSAIPPHPPKKHMVNCAFDIQTSTRTWHFITETSEEVDRWVKELQAVRAYWLKQIELGNVTAEELGAEPAEEDKPEVHKTGLHLPFLKSKKKQAAAAAAAAATATTPTPANGGHPTLSKTPSGQFTGSSPVSSEPTSISSSPPGDGLVHSSDSISSTGAIIVKIHLLGAGEFRTMPITSTSTAEQLASKLASKLHVGSDQREQYSLVAVPASASGESTVSVHNPPEPLSCETSAQTLVLDEDDNISSLKTNGFKLYYLDRMKCVVQPIGMPDGSFVSLPLTYEMTAAEICGLPVLAARFAQIYAVLSSATDATTPSIGLFLRTVDESGAVSQQLFSQYDKPLETLFESPDSDAIPVAKSQGEGTSVALYLLNKTAHETVHSATPAAGRDSIGDELFLRPGLRNSVFVRPDADDEDDYLEKDEAAAIERDAALGLFSKHAVDEAEASAAPAAVSADVHQDDSSSEEQHVETHLEIPATTLPQVDSTVPSATESSVVSVTSPGLPSNEAAAAAAVVTAKVTSRPGSAGASQSTSNSSTPSSLNASSQLSSAANAEPVDELPPKGSVRDALKVFGGSGSSSTPSPAGQGKKKGAAKNAAAAAAPAKAKASSPPVEPAAEPAASLATSAPPSTENVATPSSSSAPAVAENVATVSSSTPSAGAADTTAAPNKQPATSAAASSSTPTKGAAGKSKKQQKQQQKQHAASEPAPEQPKSEVPTSTSTATPVKPTVAQQNGEKAAPLVAESQSSHANRASPLPSADSDSMRPRAGTIQSALYFDPAAKVPRQQTLDSRSSDFGVQISDQPTTYNSTASEALKEQAVSGQLDDADLAVEFARQANTFQRDVDGGVSRPDDSDIFSNGDADTAPTNDEVLEDLALKAAQADELQAADDSPAPAVDLTSPVPMFVSKSRATASLISSASSSPSPAPGETTVSPFASETTPVSHSLSRAPLEAKREPFVIPSPSVLKIVLLQSSSAASTATNAAMDTISLSGTVLHNTAGVWRIVLDAQSSGRVEPVSASELGHIESFTLPGGVRAIFHHTSKRWQVIPVISMDDEPHALSSGIVRGTVEEPAAAPEAPAAPAPAEPQLAKLDIARAQAHRNAVPGAPFMIATKSSSTVAPVAETEHSSSTATTDSLADSVVLSSSVSLPTRPQPGPAAAAGAAASIHALGPPQPFASLATKQPSLKSLSATSTTQRAPAPSQDLHHPMSYAFADESGRGVTRDELLELQNHTIKLHTVVGSIVRLFSQNALESNESDAADDTKNPAMGSLVRGSLCSALAGFLLHGLKQYRGFMMSRLDLWQVVEASTVSQTSPNNPVQRQTHRIVSFLNGHALMAKDSSMKYRSFVCALLNDSLLESWLLQLHCSDDILPKFYEPNALLRSASRAQMKELATTVHPLTAVRFKLHLQFEVRQQAVPSSPAHVQPSHQPLVQDAASDSSSSSSLASRSLTSQGSVNIDMSSSHPEVMPAMASSAMVNVEAGDATHALQRTLAGRSHSSFAQPESPAPRSTQSSSSSPFSLFRQQSSGFGSGFLRGTLESVRAKVVENVNSLLGEVGIEAADAPPRPRPAVPEDDYDDNSAVDGLTSVSAAAVRPGMRVIALSHFVAHDMEQLAFCKGDEMVVSDRVDDRWALCTLNSITGLVPLSLIAQLD
ncbi:hypothetical protein, variant [Capsaspora owczarzaki ATCC 30864]|nr:hypothetical protein, variant [Capsaspora owczarzaki ATCC 30864]